MIRSSKVLLLGCLFILLSNCGNDDQASKLSSDKAITEFTILNIGGTIDEPAKAITMLMPLGTDITSLTPTILISNNASINPASGVTQDFSNPVIYTVTAEDKSSVRYTITVTTASCAKATNIYSFTYEGRTYEVVKENKTWMNAAACAVERGGFLAEINDVSEQNAIFMELQNNAAISTAMTKAPDGGNASYVWIGGNDLATEGNWVWDGNNDGESLQFWMGKANGTPVGDRYNNWGNEPDNFGSGQDGLGLALTDWPFGMEGQWNDVDVDNALYFVIEYDE